MYVNILKMAVTTNTSHYLQWLDITNEGKYNGTCTPLFNFVIAQKKYKNKRIMNIWRYVWTFTTSKQINLWQS